ncbi:uncharacterized protein LOC127246884 [Andrographis paniculata]|uniref:uncharacterized protein LOC127246884 n=1 Tax=Andrographis paniculata TaxID=175694 RepID=UPI0021E6D9A4|nr:uncharacterized protein LOC127246884 [Andrographis paniculata]
MEVEAEASTAAGDLVGALEQAALMAKQLGNCRRPSQIAQIQTALYFAHHHLSQILSQFPPASHPPRGFLPTLQSENSVSSAVGGGEENGETGGGEPMQMGDDDEEEQNSQAAAPAATALIVKVEEKMRDCFIQNKRPKRRLSPAAEPRRVYGDEGFRDSAEEFDPIGTKLRSLDLIYQFHA